jgi:putative transposase
MTPDSFNLDPPPYFQGLDPHRPLNVYQRNLPHWRQDGATYFVTFHLADALPAAKRRELESIRRDWIRTNPSVCNQQLEQFAREQFRRIEQLIDAGHGACWFREPRYIDELRRAILHFQAERYEVGALVIMANHCHLTIRPFEQSDLEEVVGSIKSVVSHFVNRHQQL